MGHTLGRTIVHASMPREGRSSTVGSRRATLKVREVRLRLLLLPHRRWMPGDEGKEPWTILGSAAGKLTGREKSARDISPRKRPGSGSGRESRRAGGGISGLGEGRIGRRAARA